jgi:predicted negative regulator of RcsB-dependent stress response
MPDPAQVDSMLDQMTPEQLTAQAEMMDNLTPEQMRAMGLPEGVDREQLKMASQMMKNMGKDEMKSMMKMAAQMAPQMQASRAASSGGAGASTAAMPPMPRRSATTPMPGMSTNPDMSLDQGMEMMKNMSPDDVRRNMKQAEAVLPKRAATTSAAPTISVVERLKTSKLSVPETVIAAVEKGEAAKVEGNSSFKSADYSAAATKYCSAIELVEPSLKQLSGADKKAVAELMTACQLNLANCHLKLQDWDAATAVCTNVLERGEDRKARFRRGDALRAQGKLEEARADLAVAVKMDPSDAVVVGKLREVEAALCIEEEARSSSPSRIPDPTNAGQ